MTPNEGESNAETAKAVQWAEENAILREHPIDKAPISTMEATGKQPVSLRLKGSGRQWSNGGAVARVALIAHRINGS